MVAFLVSCLVVDGTKVRKIFVEYQPEYYVFSVFTHSVSSELLYLLREEGSIALIAVHWSR